MGMLPQWFGKHIGIKQYSDHSSTARPGARSRHEATS
jgi:hypothetical protein